MKKHVVFMVHGLGEQVPGDTVDEFVGAACKELELTGPVTNNTLNLVNADETKEHILGLFPSHQRRMNGPNEGEVLVFAEVHWADISPAPSGVVATALDLLRLVLGMGYIALDNVQNNLVRENAWVQALVPWFVWLFYAVIAPLNLFLLIGAFALLIDPYPFKFNTYPGWTYALFASFGVGFAYFGYSRAKLSRSYMDKMIMRALSVLGTITVVFAALFATGVPLDGLEWLSAACGPVNDRQTTANLGCFTGLGVRALQFSWLVAVSFVILLMLCSLKGFRKNLWDKRSIYLAICSAMLILWMTITVAIWAMAVKFIQNVPIAGVVPAKDIVENGFVEATQTIVYGVFSLLVIAVVAFGVAKKRGSVRDELSKHETESSDIDKKYGRVILNPWLNLALLIGIIAFAFSSFTALAEFALGKPEKLQITGFFADLYRTAYAWDAYFKTGGTVAFFVTTAIGFLILNFSSVIASGVGVARDVTTYLTRTHRANPMQKGSNSAYFYADEIQARFKEVVAHMLDQEGRARISRITFMTHSQGTVIAAVGLKEIAKDMPVKPTLVTMGSPLTQIYGHYFEKNYQFSPESNAALKNWYNIYRGDDFVGTRVQGHKVGAQNYKVRPKGHSHYWSDQIVWDQFKKLKIFLD